MWKIKPLLLLVNGENTMTSLRKEEASGLNTQLKEALACFPHQPSCGLTKKRLWWLQQHVPINQSAVGRRQRIVLHFSGLFLPGIFLLLTGDAVDG